LSDDRTQHRSLGASAECAAARGQDLLNLLVGFAVDVVEVLA
jgi:hypothetical protein